MSNLWSLAAGWKSTKRPGASVFQPSTIVPLTKAKDAAMAKWDDLQFRPIEPMELTQDKSVPAHQGWFDAHPTDPTLTVELLLIERAVGEIHGPWRIDGALVKEPGRDPEWVDGWIDSYRRSANPKHLWDYFVEKGGGNGMTWEIGFFRIASAADAPEILAHYNERYSKENPFGLTKPDNRA